MKKYKVIDTKNLTSIINDKRISLKAKGIYFFAVLNSMLIFNLTDLKKYMKEDRKTIQSGINELIYNNYIEVL